METAIKKEKIDKLRMYEASGNGTRQSLYPVNGQKRDILRSMLERSPKTSVLERRKKGCPMNKPGLSGILIRERQLGVGMPKGNKNLASGANHQRRPPSISEKKKRV